MTTYYVDRSRYETGQRCLRARLYEYSAEGTGIQSARKPLPLAVGGAVHVGLAALLMGAPEHAAVIDALTDLSRYAGRLERDATERAASDLPVADDAAVMRAQLAGSLGLTVEEAGLSEDIDRLAERAAQGRRDADEWLWREQSALVEGMVRVYARRRLSVLLKEFEVLEVEREGTWTLHDPDEIDHLVGDSYDIQFMSRPDALLRERSTGGLYLLSYKTAASWDVRKARDAEHDMQGLSEAVEVERRRGERVLGIRYEYLLKGYRSEDKDLTQRFGFSVWTQRSPLVRRYVARSLPKTKAGDCGYALGDVCASWEYLRDDGTEGKLAWQNWKGQSVWEDGGTVKEWIDRLDDATEAMSAYDPTVGMEPRPLGWKTSAQVLGYLKTHPLDDIFIPPITVYRNDDDMRDLLEQMEASEIRTTQGLLAIANASDEAERRSAMNVHFPMNRKACEWPSTCQFAKLCYGGEDIRRDPLGSGEYVRRVANHPQEVQREPSVL